MKFEEILADLRKGIYQPVYLLNGEEEYFIDRITYILEHYVLKEEERSFNQSVLYGKDVDIPTIIGECKRYPMMSDKVVVIVKEAQHLVRTIDQLEAYVKNPNPTTILVVAYKYKSLDKRKKVYKAIASKGVVMESKKLYDNQLASWISSYTSEKKRRISPKAAVLLAEYVGNNLSRISNEINKLIAVVPADEEIRDVHIEENIGISKDYNNFELTKAVGEKNLAKAIQIQQYFQANPKDNPLLLSLSTLYSFFIKVMLVHEAKDKTPAGLGRALKVNPYFIKDYQIAAKNYPLASMRRIMDSLREVDKKSKGVENISVAHGDLLKELLFKLIYV